MPAGSPPGTQPGRCGPYAAGDGSEERYEGNWLVEWSLGATPRPPTGSWGYRLFASKDADASLGEVERWGSDACYRSVGEPVGEYTVTAAGERTQTGNWGDAGFLFSWRREVVGAWPPGGGGF